MNKVAQDDYQEKLAALRTGEIEMLQIPQTEFLNFRRVWLEQADRNLFVGEAGLKGETTYRYKKESSVPSKSE